MSARSLEGNASNAVGKAAKSTQICSNQIAVNPIVRSCFKIVVRNRNSVTPISRNEISPASNTSPDETKTGCAQTHSADSVADRSGSRNIGADKVSLNHDARRIQVNTIRYVP